MFERLLWDRGGERRLFEVGVPSFGDCIVVSMDRHWRRLCFCRDLQVLRVQRFVVQIVLVEFVVAIVAVAVVEDWGCIARYAVEFVENFATRYKNVNSDSAPQHS